MAIHHLLNDVRRLVLMLKSLQSASCIAALALVGCGSQPSRDHPPEITEQDRQIGAEQHPQLLAEFGGEYRGRQAAYLQMVGNKIASASGLEGQCTFTLVNSDVVNAFAVPGCYIYVTRGLLALVGSEAELASILGHEVGHIVGAHSQRQQSRSLWRMVGVLAVSLTGSERLTQLAGEAAQFFSLSYSRKQEYEADTLGIRYLQTAGYDPYAASEMLAVLARQEHFMAETRSHDDARAIPEWARSHPLTERRVARAHEIAASTGLSDDALPENEQAYLNQADGLLYGDDPEQGFVLGRAFVHPIMRIAFTAPSGFTLTNSPQAIAIDGPDGLRGEFGGGRIPAGGLEEYASRLGEQLLGREAELLGAGIATMSNGLPTLIYTARLRSEEGEADMSFAVYDGGNGEAYHFITLARPSASSAKLVSALFRSFRRVSVEEAASLRPRQIRVVKTRSPEMLVRLSQSMAADHPRELFRLLNALEPDEPWAPGKAVKVVTYAGP